MTCGQKGVIWPQYTEAKLQRTKNSIKPGALLDLVNLKTERCFEMLRDASSQNSQNRICFFPTAFRTVSQSVSDCFRLLLDALIVCFLRFINSP